VYLNSYRFYEAATCRKLQSIEAIILVLATAILGPAEAEPILFKILHRYAEDGGLLLVAESG